MHPTNPRATLTTLSSFLIRMHCEPQAKHRQLARTQQSASAAKATARARCSCASTSAILQPAISRADPGFTEQRRRLRRPTSSTQASTIMPTALLCPISAPTPASTLKSHGAEKNMKTGEIRHCDIRQWGLAALCLRGCLLLAANGNFTACLTMHLSSILFYLAFNVACSGALFNLHMHCGPRRE